MSTNDTFELRESIAKLEKYSRRVSFAYVTAAGAYGYFLKPDFSSSDHWMFLLLLLGLAVLHREIIECRLDTVRASLRDILTKRHPEILTEDDW